MRNGTSFVIKKALKMETALWIFCKSRAITGYLSQVVSKKNPMLCMHDANITNMFVQLSQFC